MQNPLIILGASGNALDVLDVVDAINTHAETWKVVGLLDDGRASGSEYAELDVLGGLSEAGRFEGCMFINAIGSDRSFRRRPELVHSTGVSIARFATLIHPLAAVSPRARLGRGVCVNAGVSIAGHVTVGDHVSIGPGCIIGHDTVIEDHVMLAPGAIVSGFCQLGMASYVGAGAAIRQKVCLGDQALVGLGAVVLRDVAPRTTVIGSPARVLGRAPQLV